MNLDKLEKQLQSLVKDINEESFIFDLLEAYELPKASLTRLKKGDYNLAKNESEVLWKKKLFFKVEKSQDLHALIDCLRTEQRVIKQHPRFIIVTDFNTLLSLDAKTGDTLDITLKELPKHYDFFLPWAGMEKAQLQSENPADIKAAEKMGRLYDIILEDNPTDSSEARHALNIFLSRLLFCFFAEDTGIFKDDQFTNALASHTAPDGSDLQVYLQKLFLVLSVDDRSAFPQYLQNFPYVNGGLFAKEYPVPKFTLRSRKLILECGTLNWKEINPDIFGSMMQAVVHTSQRGELGMHYTSVVNIMKVIEPLFLNDLWEEFEKAGDSKTKLRKLLSRIENLRIFDPACGSGNFLIITYKELCRLEIEIFKKLFGRQRHVGSVRSLSNIKLTQFYGIELDDFAHETAKLSLWLAEHQMNLAFKEVFGDARPTLPLQDGGNIVCGNATRINWENVYPKVDENEVFIIGNPPYLGFKMQSKEQKAEIAAVFSGKKNFKKFDYITCWFYKAARYIHDTNSSFAFVSTNSVCQGEHVSLLWPHIYNYGLEISFAHKSFKWTNNAKGNAGVICIVVGVRAVSTKKKFLFDGKTCFSVKHISTYLTPNTCSIVEKRSVPLSDFPQMTLGNMPKDDGNFILSEREVAELTTEYPDSERYIRKLIGANELMKGTTRWCLWITPDQADIAMQITPIRKRIEKVREFRASSTDKSANKMARTPYKFREQNVAESHSILVPTVTSERRQYIPMVFLEKETVIVAPNNAIYDPKHYIFAIISSRMHMTWVRAVAGRLKTDYRYSSALCYNTFPFPKVSTSSKELLEVQVFNVLDAREQHSEKTMGQLYDPDMMPESLRQAHLDMDLAVDLCYRPKPFKNDDERLEYLFKLYEEMIEAEKN